MYTTSENETSLAPRPVLPDAWVSRIFDYMSGSYGSKFADLWAGSNLESVKRLWAEKLGGFRTMPDSIKEALDALDSKPFPPTLPEFLMMCREAGRRRSETVAKIEYKPTPEELAKANSMIRAAAERMARPRRDHRAWAKALKDRHESGEVLSLVQEQAYKEALSLPEEAIAA